MSPLLLSATTLATALGTGRDANLTALQEERTGLAPCRFESVDLDTWLGQIAGVDEVRIESTLAAFDCRNNRLAQLALRADGFDRAVATAARRHGANRIGVFIGTSTAGILQTELAYRRRNAEGRLPSDFRYAQTHNTFSVADFTRRLLNLSGPAVAVSAACASSAKVFGNAARMIDAGLIDAAVVGGVDSLCLTTLYGFNSLELVSRHACQPFDADRNGISIGEAGGFALVERISRDVDPGGLVVAGIGESSDAYHMSTPHPEGAGARSAILQALRMAGIEPGEVDYVNLHGTGTPSNDAAESRAVHSVFGDRTPASSTKGATGHTLGAAGIVEAIIATFSIEHGFAPAGLNTRRLDPALRVNYLLGNLKTRVDIAMSNSFGFGGANCSLVIGRADRMPSIRVIH